MNKYTFQAGAIRALRSAVTTHWLALMPVVRENGWRKSELDPTDLIDYFGSLRIRDDYALRAYERRQAPDSWGKVWAMPAGQPFADPKPNGNGKPPKPAGALDDPMQALEGDGSPYSYLCASLLARELEHFATVCPKTEWLNCFILGSDPWAHANGMGHALAGQGFSKDTTKWRWTGQQPNEWRPSVYYGQRTATVIFHAFIGNGRQRIITFEDHYLRGSYTFNRQEESVASGPAGYTW